VDFSEPSTKAVEYAVSFATHAGARLVLINILDWPVTDAGPASAWAAKLDTFRREWEVRAAEELRKAVPAETRRGSQVEEIVAVGRPSREILRVAAEVGADLIVMGEHGRGALERAMLGSTAHYVVRHATSPVLTVRVRT
jgi:universal stress protein A